MYILEGNKKFVQRQQLQQIMSDLSPKCGNDSLTNLLSNPNTSDQVEVRGKKLKLIERLQMDPGTFEQWSESEHQALLQYRLHYQFPVLGTIDGATFKEFVRVAWENLAKNGEDGLKLEQLESVAAPSSSIERLGSLLVCSSVCKRAGGNSQILQLSIPQMSDQGLFRQNLELYIMAGIRSHHHLRHPINPVVWQRALYGSDDTDAETLLRMRRLCSLDATQLRLQIKEFGEQISKEEKEKEKEKTELVVAEDQQDHVPWWKRVLHWIKKDN